MPLSLLLAQPSPTPHPHPQVGVIGEPEGSENAEGSETVGQTCEGAPVTPTWGVGVGAIRGMRRLRMLVRGAIRGTQV